MTTIHISEVSALLERAADRLRELYPCWVVAFVDEGVPSADAPWGLPKLTIQVGGFSLTSSVHPSGDWQHLYGRTRAHFNPAEILVDEERIRVLRVCVGHIQATTARYTVVTDDRVRCSCQGRGSCGACSGGWRVFTPLYQPITRDHIDAATAAEERGE